MKNRRKNILETITLLKGLEIDIDEGYKKLIKSQFGSNPGRGFGELIQNLIDSYPSDSPMEKRRGEIITHRNMISITDYGEGLDRKKIKLLLTLGGTDKDKDPSKIGMFGIGFFSIFNPKLGTQKVKVTTNCEGHAVEISFLVKESEKRPEIRTNILRKRTKYKTRIEVWFDDPGSVDKCIYFAKKALKYYPCNIKINGDSFRSVWATARDEKNKIFARTNMSGFLSGRLNWKDYVSILCKYEYIIRLPVNSFPNGGHNLKGNLLDFYSKETPYVPGSSATINNNNLRVTISRDSFYLDKNFRESVTFLNEMLMEKLKDILTKDFNKDVIVANQFIFRDKIGEYLQDPTRFKDNKTTGIVIKMLAQAKVYEVCDSREKYSLFDFTKMLSEDLPLYFSEQKTNLVWLGGNFKHDFIVLPNTCKAFNGAPEFYSKLFRCIFVDIVDLDTIRINSEKIKELVDRMIVNKSALSPECRFVGEKKLDRDQMALLLEISSILENEEIKMVISETIDIPVRNIKPTFFEVKEKGAYISTGLFNQGGEPLSDQFVTNFEEKERKETDYYYEQIDIILGIRLDHPVIQFLIASDSKHRAYYTMTYVAHELAMCQKLLVPYSPLYHLVKEKTASGMRKALIDHLINSRVA